MSKSKSVSTIQASQLSTHSKDARRSDRINERMVQNVLLIWLDANIDENTSDCQNTITHLRRIVNTIQTFTDDRECLQFLEEMADEKACMIISGALAQKVVPCVHDLSQVDSIFIFCDNKKYHEGWVKDWSKIKGVFAEIGSICEALKQAAQQCEQNAISISIMGDSLEKAGNRLDPSFMYTKIMVEILLTIKFEQKHIDEFIAHCRKAFDDNKDQLEYVDKLARQYHQKTPIWWYTCEGFLYPMLNRALRLMNADVIIKLGFFIADLHRQIEELHHEQFAAVGDSSKQDLTLYRGQGMEKEAFNKMVANKDGLMSFNNFLSTSKNRSTSLEFTERAIQGNQMVGVLFIMKIDTGRSDTPFASVADVGFFGGQEDEVLFSMHSVFRIAEITPMDENARVFQVQLNLASEKNNDLRDLMEYIRTETFSDNEGWERLGLVLWKMGESTKAEQVYETLLRQATEEGYKAPIYCQLGTMKAQQGEYAEAIEFYKKSIEIEEKQIPRNDQNLASSYNNIGLVYSSIGGYPKALKSYEKALTIRQQSLPATHPDLATSYNNIGNVYYSMGDYAKALSSHEKALTIRQQSLPPTHPDLAFSYLNIGNAYYSMGDNSKALSSHEKALAIRQQSLPPTHPDLASSYNNIGLVYSSVGDHPKALTAYEKALAIWQQLLPPTHPDMASSYNNIGNVYYRMGDYAKALSSHEKALAIKQQSFPPSHPDLASSYLNIGNAYYSMGDCLKALSFHEKALAIRQQSLPPTHPDLASSYNSIGLIHKNMGNYSEAYTSFERAVDIGQRSLPANHPRVKLYQNNLACMKKP